MATATLNMNNFADSLRELPAIEAIARLELFDDNNQAVGVIENRPGSSGSVAVYHAVLDGEGWLDAAAAERALALYCEHTADARAHPGKHPNIDRLLTLCSHGGRLRVRTVSR